MIPVKVGYSIIIVIFWGKEGGDIGKKNNTYFDTSGGC